MAFRQYHHTPLFEPLLRAVMVWGLRYLVSSGRSLYVVIFALAAALLVTRSPMVLIALCDPTSDTFHDLVNLFANR